MTIEWYDWVRVGTAVLSLTSMYYLGRSWRLRSNDYTNRLKDFWWSTNAMLFAIMVGSIEQVIRDRGITWTLSITFFAALISLKAAVNKNAMLLRSDPYVEADQAAPRTGPLRFFLDLGLMRDLRHKK